MVGGDSECSYVNTVFVTVAVTVDCLSLQVIASSYSFAMHLQVLLLRVVIIYLLNFDVGLLVMLNHVRKPSEELNYTAEGL